jgi:hypothetical protein
MKSENKIGPVLHVHELSVFTVSRWPSVNSTSSCTIRLFSSEP